MAASDDFVTLGVITGAHGIKGAVKIKPFTETPDSLKTYPLIRKDGSKLAIKPIGEAKGQIICQIEGIRYRDEAEKLKGTELGVLRSALPEPESGEFYVSDLIGMTVTLEDGSAYGSVCAMHNYGAGDIVEIRNMDGESELLPFNEDCFPHIDFNRKSILIVPPIIL